MPKSQARRIYVTNGATVDVDLAWSGEYTSTLYFVRIDVGAASDAWSVGGVAYDDTTAFRTAVENNGDTFIKSYGNGSGTATDFWTVSKGTGYSAPILVNAVGDLFTISYGNTNANADGKEHVRHRSANPSVIFNRRYLRPRSSNHGCPLIQNSSERATLML